MAPMAKKFFAASLIYLGIGLLVQAVSLFDAWLGFNPLAYTAIAATEQILLLGWLTQLGLALVYERLDAKRRDWRLQKEQPDAPVNSKIPYRKLAVSVFILFNLGLVLVIIGQPGLALFGGDWLGAAAATGGLLQLIAGLLFVWQVRFAVIKS